MCKTFVVVSMLVVGAAYAFDDCSCVCGNGQRGRVVSDGRTINEAQANADGYFLRDGKVMVFRGGNWTEMTQEVMFDNGSRLSMDGTLILRDGTRSRFRDSQFVTLDGRFMDRERMNASYRENSRDGYFLRNGRVMSFRNGTMSELTANITLDNGTRVMADGTVILKDGTRSTLGEKQWLTADGRMSDTATRDNNAARDVSHNRIDQANEQHRTDANANRNNGNANIQNNQETHRENSADARKNNDAPHNDAALKNEQNRRQAERHENATPNTTAPKTDATPRNGTKGDEPRRVESKPETNKNSEAKPNEGRNENKSEDKK